MHTFIDESGVFVIPADGTSKVSCVAALTVPSVLLPVIEIEYEALRSQWGVSGSEVKGSTLTEEQAADVIRFLAKYEVICDVCAIDMGAYTKDGITRFKMNQAEGFVSGLTDAHHPNLVIECYELRDKILAMSNQLFVQFYPHFRLLQRVLQTSTLYYSLRRPRELGSFSWIVDAKGKTTTPSERLFSIIMPALVVQRRSITLVEGADYSYFKKFYIDGGVPSEYLKRIKIEDEGPYIGCDARKVFVENLTFQDSKSSIGLQLVDLLAAIFQRAVNEKLGESGWTDLGRLFIYQKDHTVSFGRLDLQEDMVEMTDAFRTRRKHHKHVVNQIERRARQMLSPRLEDAIVRKNKG